MAAPPVFVGADQVNVTCRPLTVVLTCVTLPGTVRGVTGADAADGLDTPATLVAVTVNEYAVPFDKPGTTHDNAPDVEHDAPPGDAVAV